MKKHEGESHLNKLRAEHARLRLAYMTLYQQHLDLLDCLRDIMKGDTLDEPEGEAP